MNKLYYFTLLLVFGISGAMMAQSTSLKVGDASKIPALMERSYDDGLGIHHVAEENEDLPILLNRSTGFETTIGMTRYDLQSNNGNCNRVAKTRDGIGATWTLGFDDPNYPDRGTGYNQSTNGVWNSMPGQRLESATRTGWPNYVVTELETDFICSHRVEGDGYRIHTLRRENGENSWTESEIPTNTPFGILWPRAATADNYIYALGITPPVAFDPNIYEEYEGMDGHMLFYRSSDDGETWDIIDAIIPGIDQTVYTMANADMYQIDAKDNMVAVGFFGAWGDVRVAKSEDYGETWTMHVVHDFPLDLYNIDDGYTLDDIDEDTLSQPNPLAIETSDETGAILIDNDGEVHAWYGRMYVLDDILDDGNSSYFPGTFGLMYWNESMGDDVQVRIADPEDLDGNDTLDVNCAGIDCISLYFTSLTSHPSAGIDEDGIMYVGYSSFMEGDKFFDMSDNQHFRHIYMIASDDGGDNWTEPYDAINTKTIEQPVLIPFIEGMFPTLLRNVEDDVEMIYMQDFKPGLSVRGDMDPADDNFIQYSVIGKDEFDFISSTNNIEKDKVSSLDIFPNPAETSAVLSFELSQSSEVTLRLRDMIGQSPLIQNLGTLSEGNQQVSLNISNFSIGTYIVEIETDKEINIAKLVIQ